ncbi:MAG: sulfite exporter TauE/SafE family protein [Candidatus Omnitrophica bacterium]|nr:sulfite exporter TauE/SafE family protein [Candidatus Omnitrophota bacterium]
MDLKIALLLGTCSVAGTIFAVLTAVKLSKFWLIIFTMGLTILFTLNKNYKFSWKKITILGLIASFNKGLSAGGYGPVVTGGQLLSGVQTKSTVGITSLAEGLTCFVGLVTYFATVPNLNLKIAPYNLAGAILAVPFAAFTVKITNPERIRLVIGIITLVLGLLTIAKAIQP